MQWVTWWHMWSLAAGRRRRHVGVHLADLVLAQGAVVHAVLVERPVGLPAVQRADREGLAVVDRPRHAADIEAVLLPDSVNVHEDLVLAVAVEDERVVRPPAQEVRRP